MFHTASSMPRPTSSLGWEPAEQQVVVHLRDQLPLRTHRMKGLQQSARIYSGATDGRPDAAQSVSKLVVQRDKNRIHQLADLTQTMFLGNTPTSSIR